VLDWLGLVVALEGIFGVELVVYDVTVIIVLSQVLGNFKEILV